MANERTKELPNLLWSVLCVEFIFPIVEFLAVGKFVSAEIGGGEFAIAEQGFVTITFVVIDVFVVDADWHGQCKVNC